MTTQMVTTLMMTTSLADNVTTTEADQPCNFVGGSFLYDKDPCAIGVLAGGGAVVIIGFVLVCCALLCCCRHKQGRRKSKQTSL